MITIITGLPGNGKTLYAISYVKAWAEKDKRTVFYHGIKDLKLDWQSIDPQKWFEAPAGSIIVIDECQTVFRPRTLGALPPDYVAKLETHRHQGLDIVLITQHPMLCDTSIRRLTGRHLHVVRKWGTQSATIHEWPSVRDNCDKPAGRADSIKHAWPYPKSSYGLYHSAEVHTVKRNVPMKVYMMFVIPLLIAAAAGAAVWRLKHQHGVTERGSQQQPQGQGVMAQGGAAPKWKYADAKNDQREYVFERAPRIAGMPQSAPRYDEVSRPTRAPLPVACVASKTRCTCYSQQATRMDVTEPMCRDIVAVGYFVDFDEKSRQGGDARPQQVSYVPPDARVLQSQAQQQPKPAQLDDPTDEDGFGPLGRHGPGVRDWQKEAQGPRPAPKSSSPSSSSAGFR